MYIFQSKVRAPSIVLQWLTSVIEILAKIGCTFVDVRFVSWAALICARKLPYISVIVVAAKVVQEACHHIVIANLVVGSS